jgi:hypothetical protein
MLSTRFSRCARSSLCDSMLSLLAPSALVSLIVSMVSLLVLCALVFLSVRCDDFSAALSALASLIRALCTLVSLTAKCYAFSRCTRSHFVIVRRYPGPSRAVRARLSDCEIFSLLALCALVSLSVRCYRIPSHAVRARLSEYAGSNPFSAVCARFSDHEMSSSSRCLRSIAALAGFYHSRAVRARLSELIWCYPSR